MSPDWTSDDTPERDKTHPHPAHASDLPIINPNDDEDFDEDFDDEDPDEEALDLEMDSEPRVVLITGACGNIGRKLRRPGMRFTT